jgi:hypothetical protein
MYVSVQIKLASRSVSFTAHRPDDTASLMPAVDVDAVRSTKALARRELSRLSDIVDKRLVFGVDIREIDIKCIKIDAMPQENSFLSEIVSSKICSRRGERGRSVR